jgi:class 3 adenylate cyclase
MAPSHLLSGADMSQTLGSSLAELARDALARHAWGEAYELLSEADTDGRLSADELELLAQAAWWVGRLPDSIEARERAYTLYVKAGNSLGAAIAAGELASDHSLKNAHAVAAGWMRRAERLLEGLDESVVHGWLAMMHAFRAALVGEYSTSAAQASRAREIAERFGDRDLAILALSVEGEALVNQGEVDKGLAMLEEAAVSAVAGEIEPLTAGRVCCSTIATCTTLGDLARAAQWTEAQDRWCERERINGFPGMCRLYRAEIKRMRGSWLEAEAEARRASDELKGFVPAAVGVALYEIGMIRLRRGDLTAAEDALLRAHEAGRDPEPALSLLRLAQDDAEAAATSIRRALQDPPRDPSWGSPPGSEINRLALLPAQVEIAIASGDLDTARAAADELRTLAERFKTTSTQASAAGATGAVALAEGQPSAAEHALRDAISDWTELETPYEAARARFLLAKAYQADGDLGRAALELRAARSAFERLGADPDRRRVDELLSTIGAAGGGRPIQAPAERVARAFVFTDIVDSTRLAEELGDERWNEVIRSHDDAVRAIVAQYGGEEVKRTGDGFFLAFDDSDRAIEAAIAIQRRLAQQEEAKPMAAGVRIGVHWAEANRAGQDYIGGGVNLAARIGSIGGAGEILVSASTLARSRRSFREVSRRTAELRGISIPVEVVAIDWR